MARQRRKQSYKKSVNFLSLNCLLNGLSGNHVDGFFCFQSNNFLLNAYFRSDSRSLSIYSPLFATLFLIIN